MTNNILPPLSTEEFEALKADIERNGVLHPVIVDEDGNILDGHHRLMICPDAPRQVVSGLTEAEKIAFTYRANFTRRNLSPEQKKEISKDMKAIALMLKEEGKTQEDIGVLLGVDRSTVSKWLNMQDVNGHNSHNLHSQQKLSKQQKEIIFEQNLNGYTQEQLAGDYKVNQSTISRIIKQVGKKREKEEIKELSDIELPKTGDWRKLGPHLLYCGDTSKSGFWQAIPNAAFAFADPPYNAEVDDWDKDFKWNHDWLIQKAPIVAVTPGIENIASFFKNDTSMPYIWSMATWIKNGMTRGKIGYGNWIYIAVFAIDSVYRQAQDHINVTIKTSETEDSSHKGRKPFDMMVKLIELFTKSGDIIIDPFLGSGTTLIAAEKTGRICIGGEINPDYCRDIETRYGKNKIST